MFHCNGWTYTWGVTAVAGTHVCLRRVEAGAIFAAIAEHGVTHLSRRADRAQHAGARARRRETALRPCRRGLDRRRGTALAVIEAMERMGSASPISTA
jgi:fatty-acyl-CoA synthase